MPVKKKRKKPVVVANRHDLIYYMHSNHNGLLPPEAFEYLMKYIEKEQVPVFQTMSFCKTFLNQFIGAWGLHLSHVFSPVQCMTKRKGKAIYVPPSVKIKRSLKQFFKEEHSNGRKRKQKEENLPPVVDSSVQVDASEKETHD